MIIESTTGGWHGSITVANKVDRDEYNAAYESIFAERLAIYAARDTGAMEFEEATERLTVLRDIAALLYAEYAGDTLPEVEWSTA